MIKFLSLAVLAVGLMLPQSAWAVGPSCTLTPISSLYSGAPQYGGYPTGSGFGASASCAGSGSITYAWTQIAGTNTLSLSGVSTSTVTAGANNTFSKVSDILNLAATDLTGTSNTTIKFGTVIADSHGAVQITAELGGGTYGIKVNQILRTKLIRLGANTSPFSDDINKRALDVAQLNYGNSVFISSITNANPGVVMTATAHGFATGQQIYLQNTGMTGLLANPYPATIIVTGSTTFSIGLDTTSLGTYSGTAGTAGFLYGPYWREYRTGTCALTGGQANIVCSNTGQAASMKTDICNGTSNPVGAPSRIVVEYTGTDAKLHYWGTNINASGGCVNQFTVATADTFPLAASSWDQLPNCDSGCSGLHWMFSTLNGNSQMAYMDYINFPAAYYGAWGEGPFGFYLRSGLDDYLTMFRTFMDDMWQDPYIDQGIALDGNHFRGATGESRWYSTVGYILRALDKSNQGDNTMWAGIRIMENHWATLLGTNIPANGRIDDQRDDAYYLGYTAVCAIGEIDPTTATTCRTAISTGTSALVGYQVTVGQAIHFEQEYDSEGSTITAEGKSGSAAAIHNSTTLALSGGATCPTGGGSQDFAWFWDSAIHNVNTLPPDSLRGDSTYYTFSCSGSTMTLNKPYEGVTGTKGFMLGNPFAGIVAQSYMNGLMGGNAYLASIAMTGFNSTTVTQLQTMVIGIAYWEQHFAYNVSEGGMYSGWSPYCYDGLPTIPLTDIMCGTHGFDDIQARANLDAEILEVVGPAYALGGDLTVKAFGDFLLSEMLDKPGTGGLTSNSSYMSVWDYPLGYNLNPALGNAYTSLQGPKEQGQFFGGPLGIETWAAWRQVTFAARPSRTGKFSCSGFCTQ